MSTGLFVALLLVLVGAVSQTPGLLVLGSALGVFAGLGELWTRIGLRDLSYRREVRDRAVSGDELPLKLIVWNAKRLPLPLLRVDDLTDHGLEVPQRGPLPIDRTQRPVIENSWSLWSFQRITRTLRLRLPRRGVFEIGPARLRLAQLFGGGGAEGSVSDTNLVVVLPRSLPMRGREPRRAPLGERRTRHSLFHDPALFAGVRPFQQGDPLRHLHWRASLRTGRTMTKRFEPAAARETVIVLDVQTIEGPYWLLNWDEDLFEELCVVAASAARHLLGEGVPCGLLAAGHARAPQAIAYVPPRADLDHLGRIGDLLARLPPIASRPFPRVLAALPQRVPAGVTILVLSARDPALFLPHLRRLHRSGFAVRHLAVGGKAPMLAARARQAGLDSQAAELAGGWRNADVVALA